MRSDFQLLLLMLFVWSCAANDLTAPEKYCTTVGRGGVNSFDVAFGAASIRSNFVQDLEDVAFLKTTYASAHYAHHVSSFAVDGDDTTFYHSAHVLHPFLVIDLGEVKTVYHVVILVRQDCCAERFNNAEIRLGSRPPMLDGNFRANQLLHYFRGPMTLPEGALHCTFQYGVKGRYLSIQMVNGKEYLHLATVKVYAK